MSGNERMMLVGMRSKGINPPRRIYTSTWIEDQSIPQQARGNGQYSIAEMLASSLARRGFDLRVFEGQTARGFFTSTSVQVHGAAQVDRDVYLRMRHTPEVTALMAALTPSVLVDPDVEACKDWKDDTKRRVKALKLDTIASSLESADTRPGYAKSRKSLAPQVREREKAALGSLHPLTEADLERIVDVSVERQMNG